MLEVAHVLNWQRPCERAAEAAEETRHERTRAIRELSAFDAEETVLIVSGKEVDPDF